MGAQSKIEWTDASWNPIRARVKVRTHALGQKIGWFCTHASEGCRHCYAEVMNRRLGTGIDYKAQNANKVEIFLDETMLTAPLRWKRPRKIFVGSMTDLFGEFVPDEMIDKMFAVMALCPQHTFQVLTKRAERMREYCCHPERDRLIDAHIVALIGERCAFKESPFGGCTSGWPLPNVWLGVSCEDQANADARIPHLLATPAAVRFLSCEPLLGRIDLTWLCNGHAFFDSLSGRKMHDPPEGTGHSEPCAKIDWVICGGESGSHARPMHPDWARLLRDQCVAAGVPFFFKQWGNWKPGVLTQSGHTMRTDSSEGLGSAGLGTGMTLGAPPHKPSYVHIWKGGPECSANVGKAKAGRKLDGIEHNAFPENAP